MKSISRKLMKTFLLVVIISLLFSNLLVFFIMRKVYSEELIKNYKNINENVAVSVNNDLESIVNLVQIICMDPMIRKLVINMPEDPNYEFFSTQLKIVNQLTNYSAMNIGLIDDIYFICKDGTIISRNGYHQDTLDEEWYEEFMLKDVKFGFSRTHDVLYRENFSTGEKKRVVTYIAGMYSMTGDSYEDRFMGRIVVDIKWDSLLREADKFQGYQYAIYSETGDVLGSNEQSISLSPRELYIDNEKIEKNHHLYHKIELSVNNWIFVTKIPENLVDKSLVYIGAIIAGIILVMMGITGVLVKICSVIVTEPLEKLACCMLRFSKGDFHAYAEISSGDEVEKIATIYNNMIDNMNWYMNEIVIKEKEKKESEMRFLMAQIKPHFIYNSLNCIIYLARQNRDEDIIMFTRSFISMLQSSIKKSPKEMVPLVNEAEYIKDYLTLIRYRYGYSPIFELQISKECKSCTVPVMILQPIIENCIFHGLSESMSEGRIVLSAEVKKGKVKISVYDNGSGLYEDELAELITSIEQHEMLPKWCEHIGLVNVNERLKLCYGKDHGLHIESKHGEGTLVWFEGEVRI